MTVVMEDGKKKEEEKNEIDESFKEYVGKVKPPNSHKEWWDYIGIMWANAYSMGMSYTINAMKDELEKAKDEK